MLQVVMGVTIGRYYTARLYITALSTCILLTACFNHIVMDRDAPELRKRYVLTETLVLSAMKMNTPTFGQPFREVPYVMTRPYFESLLEGVGSLAPEIRERGVLPQGTPVQVKKLFINYEPSGSIRQAELRFTDTVTGEQTTTYATWNDIQSKLEEIK